jgi:hypothetical protein
MVRYRITIRVLVVLAAILAFLAIFGAWVDRQALDTDEWVDTSGRLLEDKEISDALATYAVDQLYGDVDVAALVKRRLPPDLKPYSAPAAAGIRELATRGAQQLLQSEPFQAVWTNANRIAHEQLVSILKGNNGVVASQNNKVVLNLRPLVLELADQIGLRAQADELLPPDAGQLVIADSKNLDTARTVVRLIEGLAWLFAIGTLALFALAAYLAKGRRWKVVLAYGLGLIAAGLAAIAVRAALKGLFVDSLANTEAANLPAQHAWDISTSLLHSIAVEVIIYGAFFVIASYLASPGESAVAVRRALAPTLRRRAGLVWSVFGAVALTALILFPPADPRQLVVTLLLIALAGVGVVALGRKTAREFPDAHPGAGEFPGAMPGETVRAVRARARRMRAEVGQRITSAVRAPTDQDQHPDDARLERLERLGELKERGLLTATEFRGEKKRILEDKV